MNKVERVKSSTVDPLFTKCAILTLTVNMPDIVNIGGIVTIIDAERTWRKAWDEHARIGSARTLKAENDAWDAYTDLCNEVEQCQEPGCRETVPEYAYCPRHQPK